MSPEPEAVLGLLRFSTYQQLSFMKTSRSLDLFMHAETPSSTAQLHVKALTAFLLPLDFSSKSFCSASSELLAPAFQLQQKTALLTEVPLACRRQDGGFL